MGKHSDWRIGASAAHCAEPAKTTKPTDVPAIMPQVISRTGAPRRWRQRSGTLIAMHGMAECVKARPKQTKSALRRFSSNSAQKKPAD